MAEDKKQTKLTVKEIQEIAPLADVFELNPHGKYLVRIKKSNLIVDPNMYKQKAGIIAKLFDTVGIPCLILIGSDDVEFYELKEKKV
jgi:hypothetical protein